MNAVMRCRLRTAATTVLFIALAASMSLVLADDTDPTQAWPAQLVDSLYSALSTHQTRSEHPNGIVLGESLAPTTQARTLNHASFFATTTVASIVRF